MHAVLFLSLVFILGAAVPFPWWPNSSYGRSQHHRLRDKQPPAYETKVFDHGALQKAAVRLKALDERSTPEASQKAAVKLCDGDLMREFEERWSARRSA
jgi:hypothetical protein